MQHEDLLNRSDYKSWLRDAISEDLTGRAFDSLLKYYQADDLARLGALVATVLDDVEPVFLEKNPWAVPDPDDAEEPYAEEKRLDDRERARDMNETLKPSVLE